MQRSFAHDGRAGIKRPTDSAMSAVSGQIDITSKQTSTTRSSMSANITTIGQTSTSSDLA